jgi:hypothetical protein
VSNPDLENEHCKDCCCARSWAALGISEYTGKSIPEHIASLRAENAALREAAGRVTCERCQGTGKALCMGDTKRGEFTFTATVDRIPCPDCAGILALLEQKP